MSSSRLAGAVLLVTVLAQPAAAEPSPEARARAAFVALHQTSPGVRAVWRGGTPVLVTGLEVPTEGATPAERATAFVSDRADLLGGVTLRLEGVEARGDRTLARFAQTHQGLRVADRSVIVTLDAGGRVARIHNDAAPLVDVRPAHIDAAAAARAAANHVHGPGAVNAGLVARKVVFARGTHGTEGYLVRVPRLPLQVLEVRVDGVDGRVFGARDTVLR